SNAELHVPLAFVFAPGDPLQDSRSTPDWVSLVDVSPTLIELLDLHPTQAAQGQLDGRSLAPALRGEPLPNRPVFAECGEALFPGFVHRRVQFNIAGRLRAVIHDNHKLVWTPGLDQSTAYQMYDLTRDPGELSDLYLGDHDTPDVREMRTMLDEWFQSSAH